MSYYGGTKGLFKVQVYRDRKGSNPSNNLISHRGPSTDAWRCWRWGQQTSPYRQRSWLPHGAVGHRQRIVVPKCSAVYIYIFIPLITVFYFVTGDFFRCTSDRTTCLGVDSASESEYQGTKINQRNAQINSGLIYYWSITPTCFGPSVEAIIREFEILESYKAIVLIC